jgi:ribosomal protein S18 acetylase RimI-like enzyme
MQVDIRKASHKDVESLQYIGRQTFHETFAPYNTAADMNKYLEGTFNKSQVVSELENPDSLFFIAWEGSSVIGYLKLSIGEAQTELREAGGLEIERIYVLSSYHGLGLGQLLYDKAIDVARSLHKAYVWLGVWEANARAIRFYEKNGFVAFDTHKFLVGDDEQTDIMMKKVLDVHS